jgi:hypothetical protein
MRAWSKRERRASGEEGASLILALVFILMVGSVTAALLPYTAEGGTEATNAAAIRSAGNGADGAVEGAIGSVRFSSTAGSTGFPCPTYTAPGFPQPIISTALSVTVTCRALDNSAGKGPADQPQFSILALDNNRSSHVEGRDGLYVNNNFQLVSDGGIYSNSNIDTSGQGQQQVNVFGGSVYAAGSCASDVFASEVVHCPLQAGDPVIGDPGYGSVYGTLPTAWANANADPLGTCSSNASVVKFSPGYYSQLPQPDPASCAHNSQSVWWLSPGSGPDPGVYYFDFPDAAYGAGFSNSLSTWNIPRGLTVVGGTPNGWVSATAASTVASLPAGTLCSAAGLGIQLVVGGPTNIDVSGTGNAGGRVEVCGGSATESFTGSSQHIALYGLSTGTTRAPITSPSEMPATAASSGSPAFSNPTHGEVTDGSLASVVLNHHDSASLSLSDFSLPSNLPGALITKVVLKVTHQEGPDPNQILSTPTLKVTLGSGTPIMPTLTPGASVHTDSVDLTSAIGGDAAATTGWRDLEGLTAQYVASASGTTTQSATDSVDGMEVDITYVAPATEAVRCPSGQVAPCYLFVNDKSAIVSFVGTVYTPTAQLQPTIFNTGALLFRRGVIAKDIDVQLSASAKQLAAPFQLPGETSFREVLFTASLNGQVVLQAKVRFNDSIIDAAGSPLLSPGASVAIEEWTVLP